MVYTCGNGCVEEPVWGPGEYMFLWLLILATVLMVWLMVCWWLERKDSAKLRKEYPEMFIPPGAIMGPGFYPPPMKEVRKAEVRLLHLEEDEEGKWVRWPVDNDGQVIITLEEFQSGAVLKEE